MPRDRDPVRAAGAVERILRRDRAIVLAALGAIVLLSWGWVLSGAGMGMTAVEMSSLTMALGPNGMASAGMAMGAAGPAMPVMAMAMPAGWDAAYAVLMFFMWWIMMVAMMTPSAAPTILLHAAVARNAETRGGAPRAAGSSALFAAGYLAAWAGFSVVAVALQWSFEAAGILSPMMLNATNSGFAGAILVIAGLWQLTPLKQACLRHCRGPVDWLSRHWRPGAAGALRMGLHHGAYCLGCCWGLMAILFFGGIMNLWWIVGLALIVLIEKLAPAGPWVARLTGGVLLAWGASFIAAALGN